MGLRWGCLYRREVWGSFEREGRELKCVLSPFAKGQMTYSCSVNLVKSMRLDKGKRLAQGDTSGNQ